MNKAELIKKIAEKAELSQTDSKKALEATIDAIKEALADNDSISLIGFGTFSVAERPAREGFNPLTKEKIQIAAKKVVKFKAGEALTKAL
ncbi:MAG: HU family DNA-binding protein [Prevotella sp.]|nr:HU family DNA-binding protein [Prevotella sp.]